MDNGCVVWLTGLPGSGKTTIARMVEQNLHSREINVEVLDGDEVRKNLSPELGFTKQDRETHARRVVYIAKLLSRNDVVTLVALISPYREFRQYARETIGKKFVEVWVKASPETCKERDPKGLYKKAQEGKITNLTGPQDPYEPPVNPELIIDTETEPPAKSSERVLNLLNQLGYVAAVNLRSN